MRQITRDIAQPVVLDIPCGTGRITELLLKEGLTVTGGDISAEMIAVAKEKCAHFGANVFFRQLDLDYLTLDDNSVDLVTCIRLFHHLESDARARILGELARVTRQFVIVNVSYSSPAYRLRRRIKRTLGLGWSKTSSTWTEILHEASSAGLRIKTWRFISRLLSEDLILVFTKLR